MVGGREVAQIKRASGPTDGVEVSRPAVNGQFEGTRCSRLDRGGRGRGSRHNRLHSVAFCPLCSPPPCAVTGGPEEKGVGVGVGVLC